ncbi:hypothetical protein PoB_006399300 [Plakobranchus ocellatus]|uniref:Uncharacterized protein n=1 Tax=Plakobranchus ocellatus TaxID=259542 RepID=A0AAV4D033_9GAST|nr:hypothetical protein PoB_006399300 [Plakobranchus ocellatus]
MLSFTTHSNRDVFRNQIDVLIAVIGAQVKMNQHGDLRLLGPASGQGGDGGTRTCDRRVSADLRVDSLTTVPPTSKRRKRAEKGKGLGGREGVDKEGEKEED